MPLTEGCTRHPVDTRKPWDEQVKHYQQKIIRGPTWTCCCCGGLFFQEGVKDVSKETIESWKLSDISISHILCLKTQNRCKYAILCINCCENAKSARVPKLALSNGLEFPPLPDELKVDKIYLSRLDIYWLFTKPVWYLKNESLFISGTQPVRRKAYCSQTTIYANTIGRI